jgi:hypothetical protein
MGPSCICLMENYTIGMAQLYFPEGNNRKREYYLNGIQYSETEWKERVKGREGLPWYKGSGAKARF